MNWHKLSIAIIVKREKRKPIKQCHKMMRNIVNRMSDEEMKAVSEYIEGLH